MMTDIEPFQERQKIVNIRPYGSRLHLVVSTDLKKSFARRRLKVDAGLDNPYAFVWFRQGCGDIFAFLPEECGLGATAHEMLHVVAFVMRESDIPFTRDTEEAFTYLLEELVQTAAEFIHHKDKKKYRK